MSFAGHVFDMIARMKANERRKRRPFDREVDAKQSNIRPHLLRPAKPEELQAVREMIGTQRRSERRIEWIVLTISIVLISLVAWWFF